MINYVKYDRILLNLTMFRYAYFIHRYRRLFQEDDTFGDYVDDYRDDYEDDTHEPLPTSTNTSNLESNTSKDVR